MSGGSFNYAYQKAQWFADDLEERLDVTVPENGWTPEPETTKTLREIVKIARYAARLMKEAEWLYSGDTGDDSFMERVMEIESSNAKLTGDPQLHRGASSEQSERG